MHASAMLALLLVWPHCRLTAVQDCHVEHFASFSPAQKVWLVKVHMARSSGVSGGHSHHLQCSIAANCLCPSFSLLSITVWPFALARAHHQGVAAHGGYCCVEFNDMQQYAWLEVGGMWSIHQKGCSPWGSFCKRRSTQAGSCDCAFLDGVLASSHWLRHSDSSQHITAYSLHGSAGINSLHGSDKCR